jgi:hypothetical protein
MNAVTNIWRQLVQRRLWPVAVLLLGALVAVPLVLAKEPEPQPEPQPAQVDTKSELATTPIVAQASIADRGKRRRVLGTKKNPFAMPEPAEAETSGPSSSSGPTGSSGTGGLKLPDTSSGMPSSGSPSAPLPSGPSLGAPPIAPQAKPVERKRHSVTLRFGAGDPLERMNVKKLEALPLGEEPLVVYLGVEDGGKTAVFLVDSSIEPQGDGVCKPDPNTCETIELREGETEFFDIVDENGESIAEYQLDLVEIHGGKKRSTSGRTASAKGSGPGALQDRADAAGVARTADAGLGLALPLPLP